MIIVKSAYDSQEEKNRGEDNKVKISRIWDGRERLTWFIINTNVNNKSSSNKKAATGEFTINRGETLLLFIIIFIYVCWWYKRRVVERDKKKPKSVKRTSNDRSNSKREEREERDGSKCDGILASFAIIRITYAISSYDDSIQESFVVGAVVDDDVSLSPPSSDVLSNTVADGR